MGLVQNFAFNSKFKGERKLINAGPCESLKLLNLKLNAILRKNRHILFAVIIELINLHYLFWCSTVFKINLTGLVFYEQLENRIL